jgi:hypothetical protein
MRRYLSPALLLLALLICAGPASGIGRSSVPPAPLKTFDLTVSLEWQPGTADSLPDDMALAGCSKEGLAASYLEDLKQGLRQTAAYLYSYSEGQLALGKVTIYSGGDRWEAADLRVLASNSYRPSAFVGGIVDSPTQNISATSGLTATVFYPATILLGRAWDGRGARCGGWSQPAGWRTIGHEWAHYALFLYDEYFNATTNAEQYCTTTSLDLHARPAAPRSLADSLMAYHYSADKLWLMGDAPAHEEPPAWSCKDTLQNLVHGETDWQTIARFYPSLTLPIDLQADIPFEGSAAESSFDVVVVDPPAPAADTSAEVRVAALPEARLVGQAYLLRLGSKGEPVRIVGQGEVVPGEAAALPFWGVQPSANDRALVVVPSWLTGERFAFPASSASAPALSVAAPNTLDAKPSVWRPSLTVVPRVIETRGISNVSGLDVTLRDCSGSAKRIMLAYCPAGSDCQAPVTVSVGAGGLFQHTLFFGGATPPASLYGYIYARNMENGEETATWYQLGGGVGPATGNGHAPLADPIAETNPEPGQPVPAADTGVLFGPAQSCNGGGYILPAGVLGIAGTPVDIQPVVADGNGGQPWDSRRGIAPLRVRLSYNQDLLDRLGIGEEQLVVLRLEKGQRLWQPVAAAAQSRALDWIAAEARPFNGQGAIYALGYGPARVWLPTVVR